MPEEWPIRASLEDQPNAPPGTGGRDRLRTVRTDFFLSPADRLSEQERALMTAMLHCLVSDVVDQLRAALPVSAAANDDGNLPLTQRLAEAGLLDRTELVRLLLRRADEERVSSAARSRSGRRDARVLQGLVSHSNGQVAATAMSLIIARGRRRDPFGQCLLHFDDLSDNEASALVHAVAALMRSDLSKTSRPAEVDRMLAAAAREVVARQDRANSLDSLTASLVDLLHHEQALTDDLMLSAALEGEMIFVAQALAKRADIHGGIAFDELMSGDSGRAMALLRMGGVSRQSAAGMLAGVGDLLGLSDPGTAISIFDMMDEAEVEDRRAWLTTDPQYRRAVTVMDQH
ncbi:DUF2336 domain-containing protein [Sphingomonas sp. F9_3S_D5_B_2]